MNIYNFVNTLVIILVFSVTSSNLAAFGVEGATTGNSSIVVAENTVSKEEVSNVASKETPFSEMEAKHIGNPESIEAGRVKFGNTCLFCHGPKGVGSRAPTLVSNGFAPGGVNDNEYFITTIKYGRPGTIMGAFEGTLTETEMWQVIAYLRDQAEKVAAKK